MHVDGPVPTISAASPTLPMLSQIETSNKFLMGMWAVLATCTFALGPLAMLNLYVVPYWINVVWLDAVTYLHHHGPHDNEPVPWYRGKVCAVTIVGLSPSLFALPSTENRRYYPCTIAQHTRRARRQGGDGS